MVFMVRATFFRFAVILAAFGLLLTALPSNAQSTDRRGRKYKAPPPTARIDVTVLRDVNGKAIENAAVVFHSIEGDRDTGNMELKTNSDGKTVIDVLPIGCIARVQIIARGFQTYGADYKVDKPEMSIEIKLKRPGAQYSIYPPRETKPKAEEKPVPHPDGEASPGQPQPK